MDEYGGEIYVDTRYPAPPDVDGVVYYVAEDAPIPATWGTTEVPTRTPTETALVGVPVPLEVIEQKVSYAFGGSAVASGVLIIDEIPYVGDYEIRIVPR